MTVKIFKPENPMPVRTTFRERYRFDDLRPGYCMELTHGEHEDDVEAIVNAYGAYAQHRGFKYSREKTDTGYIIWRTA